MSFRMRYLPALDGMRGLAVLAVMAHHAGWRLARGGYVGVDVFFVLSGFLITALLAQEWEQSGKFDLRSFYIRRALRLMPALYLLLAAYVAYAAAVSFRIGGDRWWQPPLYAATYVTNWVRALAGVRSAEPLGHTWSLSIEEQFYVAWPLLLRGLLRSRLSKGQVLGVIVGLIVAAAGTRTALWHAIDDPVARVHRVYNGFDTRADSLLVGCLLALALSWGRLPAWCTRPTVLRAASAGSILLLALVTLRLAYDSALLYHGGLLLIAGAAAVLIVQVLHDPPQALSRVLEAPLLVGIGRISYGLYLWHYPIFVLMRGAHLPAGQAQLIQWALSFGLALLSFHFVEQPCLRLKKRFRQREAVAR
jgi:peptidoglycan/LPS O-acetylase OafA/YrhL